MIEWLWAFLFTQLVEAPLYTLALRPPAWLRTRTGDQSIRAFWPALGLAFAASLITHPFVWFAFPLLPAPYEVQVVCAEAFAVGVEWGWLRAYGLRRALAWSLLANALSLGLGLWSRAVFGVP